MSKEPHPYLKYFDTSQPRKYLIIGTFPPNKKEREGKSTFADYFYGNKGSLWSILKETKLFAADSFKDFDSVRKWEKQYSVGVTDVLKSCNRKEGKTKSSDDSDLLITKEDLNTDLQEYLRKYIDKIQLIYFTSSSTQTGSNSAFYWFGELMGDKFLNAHSSKLFTKLPSPSGRFLTSKAIFSNSKNTNGLNQSFLHFLEQNGFDDAIVLAKRTFEEKQDKVKLAEAAGKKASTVKQVRFPNAHKDYPSLFRIEKYKQAFKLLCE